MSRIIQALLVFLFVTLEVGNFYVSFQSPAFRAACIHRAAGKRRSYYESLKRNNFDCYPMASLMTNSKQGSRGNIGADKLAICFSFRDNA